MVDKKSIKKSASEEHQYLVELSNKLFGGEIVCIRGNANLRGLYFPDVSNNKFDIEIEIINNNLRNKIKNKNFYNGKKKILIIGYPTKVKENFNEIYGFDVKNNKFIRLK